MSLFDDLGINPTDQLDVVKLAFRKRFLLWHPDRIQYKLAELDHTLKSYLSSTEQSTYDTRDAALCNKKFLASSEAWAQLDTQEKLTQYFQSLKNPAVPEGPVVSEKSSSADSVEFITKHKPVSEPPQFSHNPQNSTLPLTEPGNIKVFIPVYLSNPFINPESDVEASKANYLSPIFVHPGRFTEAGFDWNTITQILNGQLRKDPFFQVGITEAEAKAIANQHSWHKYHSGYFIVEASLPVQFLSPEKLSERDVSGEHILNARTDDYFHLGKGTRLNEENIDGLRIMDWRGAYYRSSYNSFWKKVEAPMVTEPNFVFLDRMKTPYYPKKNLIAEPMLAITDGSSLTAKKPPALETSTSKTFKTTTFSDAFSVLINRANKEGYKGIRPIMDVMHRLKAGKENIWNPYWMNSGKKLERIINALNNLNEADSIETLIRNKTSDLYKALNMQRICCDVFFKEAKSALNVVSALGNELKQDKPR